jgi:hypothetical protein
MIDRLPILALLAIASLPAGAAAPAVKRNFSVPSFDRIRIDGPYQVALHTGVSPYARASGGTRALDGLSVRVEGRTLVVRAGSGSWGGFPGEDRGAVTIEVGTPSLTNAWINGAGALLVDKVRGQTFELAIQGPGMARIDSIDIDTMKVGITGAGTARLAGRVGKLTATVRGTSNFDADGLTTRDAVIGAEGPSIVRTAVTGTAKVDALGLAAVTLAGEPSCTINAKGSASVSGCK